jgi:hypothetical protein
MRLNFGRQALASWLVALTLLAGLDVAILKSGLLFRPWAFESSRDPAMTLIAQSFSITRKMNTPTPAGRRRVVLLGSSRAMMGAWHEPGIERRMPPSDDPIQFDNLAMFGAAMPELAAIARWTTQARPDLAMLAIGPAELLTPPGPAHSGTRLLRRGWSWEDILSGEPFTDQFDRILRSTWKLYGFREFIRAALEDLLMRRKGPETAVEFRSIEEFHQRMHPPEAARAATTYQNFLRDPHLESYLAYLGPQRLAPYHRAVSEWQAPSPRALAALDTTLEYLTQSSTRTVILLMPQSPLLAEDETGDLHRPRMEASAVEAIQDAARRHGVEVIDARNWISAERFLDFHHLMPGLSGFEDLLAKEITDGLKH